MRLCVMLRDSCKDYRIFERCSSGFFWNWLRLDNHFFAHESIESFSIEVGMTCRDLVSIFLLEPNFYKVFSLFHSVECLQIVDNAQVVNVLSAAWNETMTVTLSLFQEIFNQGIYEYELIIFFYFTYVFPT